MTFFARLNCLKVSSVAAFLLFFQVSGAQMDTAAVSAVMQQGVRQLKENTAVLAVGNKDTLIYKYDTKQFNIVRGQGAAGYITQLFTTTMILMLAEEGKLSLDDKIAQYLPEYGKYGKNYITIRHCLTHHTGIEAPSKPAFFDYGKFESLEEEANAHARREIQTNPGTEFRYSDRGVPVAARIAEIVTKKRFDMLIVQKLFRPLGMRASNFSNMEGKRPHPVFGARTSAADLVTFGRMLLNGGKMDTIRLLSEASVQELRRLLVPAEELINAPKELARYEYAMGGWAIGANGKEASALLVPSFGGTALVIDFCRGYTFALLFKEMDKKLDPWADIKEQLDGGRDVHCK